MQRSSFPMLAGLWSWVCASSVVAGSVALLLGSAVLLGCGALLDLPDNPRVAEPESETTSAAASAEAASSAPGAGGNPPSAPPDVGANAGAMAPPRPSAAFDAAVDVTPDAGGAPSRGAEADAGATGAGLVPEPAAPEPAPPPRICVVTNPSISDFTFDGGSEINATFGASASFLGGTYFYPDDGELESDVSDDEWRISGVVSEVSGFGLFATGCDVIDASAFAGIRFRLSGEIESDRELVFFVETAAHQVSSVWLAENEPNAAAVAPNAGRCTPRTSRFDGSCREPRVTLPVSDDEEEIEIRWEDFGGGSPVLGVDPREITSIAWSLPASADDEYDVDIRIDDLELIER